MTAYMWHQILVQSSVVVFIHLVVWFGKETCSQYHPFSLCVATESSARRPHVSAISFYKESKHSVSADCRSWNSWHLFNGIIQLSTNMFSWGQDTQNIFPTTLLTHHEWIWFLCSCSFPSIVCPQYSVGLNNPSKPLFNQFLITGPDRAQHWLTYSTNTLPQTHTHVHRNVPPVRKTTNKITNLLIFQLLLAENPTGKVGLQKREREKQGNGSEIENQTSEFVSSQKGAGLAPGLSSFARDT